LRRDFTNGINFRQRSSYHHIERQENGNYACIKRDGTKLMINGIAEDTMSSARSLRPAGILSCIGKAIRYKFIQIAKQLEVEVPIIEVPLEPKKVIK
jgi:hypothetical protein